MYIIYVQYRTLYICAHGLYLDALQIGGRPLEPECAALGPFTYSLHIAKHCSEGMPPSG